MPVLVLTAVEVEARWLARHLRLALVAGARWPHYRSGAIEVMCVGLRADLLVTFPAATEHRRGGHGGAAVPTPA